jgi:hypothetical protein
MIYTYTNYSNYTRIKYLKEVNDSNKFNNFLIEYNFKELLDNNDNNKDNSTFKYIEKKSFIIDTDEIKKYFYTKNNSLLSNIYNFISSDGDRTDEIEDDNDSFSNRIVNLALYLTFNLTNIYFKMYQFKKLVKYINKKIIEEEKNNDNAFQKIIRFDDYKNFTRFFEIDFDLYKNNFQDSISPLVFFILLLFFFFYLLSIYDSLKKRKVNHDSIMNGCCLFLIVISCAF